MKKALSLLIILLLVFSACGDSRPEETGAAPSGRAEPEDSEDAALSAEEASEVSAESEVFGAEPVPALSICTAEEASVGAVAVGAAGFPQAERRRTAAQDKLIKLVKCLFMIDTSSDSITQFGEDAP